MAHEHAAQEDRVEKARTVVEGGRAVWHRPADPRVTDDTAYLSPAETVRLNEFARACKAAARSVTLYPATHPAIAATLGRISQLTASGPALNITVLPASLQLDGRSPARVDEAVAELAALLHAHLIGEMTVHSGGDAEAWRKLLLLLGRSADALRAEGGISRLWMTSGGRHVEIREIDYSEVLRDRKAGEEAAWDRIVANCLQGAVSLDDEAIDALIAAAADPNRINELIAKLEEKAASGGLRARAAALVRLLKTLVGAVAGHAPDQVDATLQNVATAMALVSPDVVFELLSQRAFDSDDETPRLLGDIARHMPDQTAARILAKSLIAEGAATQRLARAFHALVPEPQRQERLLAMTHDEVAGSPFGEQVELESLWTNVVELVTSYSDSQTVSDAYGAELTGARGHAIEVEQVADDPPDRVAAWLGTVSTSAVRSLDLELLLDLLRIEQDAGRWHALMPAVISEIEDLLLVADFESAERLVQVLAHEAGPDGDPGRRSGALHAIERLAGGAMMRESVSQLATIDDAQFVCVKRIALAFGEIIVQPLAEALSVTDRSRTRERLTAILIAFGPKGRQTVERLKNSANPAVRRTAIYLLREFGGSEALPDLTRLLTDTEPQVQREAVRAILNIGTDAAYDVLQQALASGTTRSREAIMQSLSLVRDERATPLFAYILRHVDHRGPLRGIYLRAIESLGALHDSEAVAPLREVLYRGEWWAPFRTAELRAAAADALGRIGTAEALEILTTAAESGTRGVRKAVRGPLARAGARPVKT